MRIDAAKEWLASAQGRARLSSLYGPGGGGAERYAALLEEYRRHFPEPARLVMACAPGRAEILGNHTDHNHGKVLAAAVSLDAAAVFSPREDLRVRLFSEGYPPLSLDLSSLSADPAEAATTASLVRGVAAGLKLRGRPYGGFDAVVSSRVFSGSGLSSSASFEVLMCAVQDALYGGNSLDPVTRAQVGQHAENAHFMKPSGLMDQMASSFGGFIAIDFRNPQPLVESLPSSFSGAGHAMVIVDTGSSHGDLTDAYSSIPLEMKAAAGTMGGRVLRDVPYAVFLENLPEVRAKTGDRACQRAMHFYQENRRVDLAASALKAGDLEGFLAAVNASGLSSWTLLQNISIGAREQPLALALARAQELLQGKGACRVHGGGFAGTTLNFVPRGTLPGFVRGMEAIFGAGCCHELDVRSEGPAVLFSA